MVDGLSGGKVMRVMIGGKVKIKNNQEHLVY